MQYLWLSTCIYLVFLSLTIISQNGCEFKINMILRLANVAETKSGARPWADTGLAPEVCRVREHKHREVAFKNIITSHPRIIQIDTTLLYYKV